MLALMEKAPFVASDEEALIAREAVSRLRPIAEGNQDVRLRVMESVDVVVPVPARALRLIVDVLTYMGDQKAVSFIPHDAELTTQQAADLLNVSRPHLIGLLERGELPFRRVGAHRRVRAADLIEHKRRDEAQRKDALDRMADLTQDLGLD
ncbi:helix-turn-helix domain-containing protein [Methylobacterium sp. E-066]|uniref:helix-turn-helix domain-containing protein n=1 Tax=Methylobacterium sp. E-066 TaxID=2836584 RepID=UPI001FB90068|nr:helix-turn-helix domain-containing protein [Methylobacterium sp. E-066]MCJ2140368.1 helix-turn-helix domain-containing protein [Methylobacterium sp. E-066]